MSSPAVEDLGALPVPVVAPAPSDESRVLAPRASRSGPLLGRTWIWPVAFGLALLALWSVLAVTDAGGRGTIPAPWTVLSELWTDRALYPAQIQSTVAEASEGLLIALLAGLVIGAAGELSPWLGALLNGPTITLVCVPALIWAPLLAVSFSPHAAKVGIAALSAFLPILIGTASGLRSADPLMSDMVRAFGGSKLTELRLVRARAAVPLFTAGLRVAVPGAVLGATIGEFVGGNQGLGIFMVEALRQFLPARIWGAGLVVTVIGAAGYCAVGALGRLVAPPQTAMTFSSLGRGRRSGAGPVSVAGRAVLSVAATLALWQLVIRVTHLDSFFAKTPLDVLHFLTTAGTGDDGRGLIWTAVRQTVPGAALGIVLGLAVGVAVAVACVADRRIESMLLPVALTLQSVPLQAFSPILVLIFGRGLVVILVISVVISFFPTVSLTTTGLRRVPSPSVDLMRALDASRWDVLVKLRLPAAVPSLFASARVAVPASTLGVIIAEYLATGTGVGHVLAVSSSESQFSLMWATAAVVTVGSVAVYLSLGALERVAAHRFS